MSIFSKNKDLKFVNYINKKSSKKRLLNFILGCFIIALAYNLFIAPNDLVPGGVGGIAIILNNLFGFDNSLTVLILNIFLLIISYFFLGKEKTKATLLGSLLLPLFLKLTQNYHVYLGIDTEKLLLNAIFGGILYGFGAGLVFKAGFTVGGTDIINQIISKYFKVTIGKSMIFSDGLIVLLSGIFFGINSMLYSGLILYIISLMSDRVVLGISNEKMFYIVTKKDEEVKEYILKYLNHGVTVFKGKGGINEKKEDVLMTVLPTKDYYRLKEGINAIDPDAFFIVTDSYEVFGGE